MPMEVRTIFISNPPCHSRVGGAPSRRCGRPPVQSVRRAAAPLGGIRQHEQVQTGEQEQGEREQRRVGHPGRRHPTPCAKATKLAMTVTVKAMDSQRWICRTHLFQSNGTSSEDEPEADRALNVRPTSASAA